MIFRDKFTFKKIVLFIEILDQNFYHVERGQSVSFLEISKRKQTNKGLFVLVTAPFRNQTNNIGLR